MSSRISSDLYLVTDRHQIRGRPFLKVIEMALEAGVRAIQLRERDLPIRELLTLAEQIKDLSHQAGASLLVNDRIDVCLAVDADGVHLRSDHLPIPIVRKLVGPKRTIGVSCHAVQDVINAEKDGADFVVLGPIYDTPSKRSYGPPLGKEIIRTSRIMCKIPIYAIGGIKVNAIQKVLESGASGIAVISSILNAEDVQETVREMITALKTARSDMFTIDRMGSR